MDRPHSERLLLRIPVGMRKDFDRYFEEELAADRSGARDPFAVKQATIDRLIAEAEGKTSDGRCFVPLYDDADGVRGVLIRPTTDAPPTVNAWGTLRTRALTPPQSPWARIALVALIGGLVFYLSLAWSLRDAPALAVAASTPTATVSATATPPPALATPQTNMMQAAAGALSLDGINPNLQAPSSLEVLHGAQSLALYRVEASATQPDGAWTPELQRGVAAWVQGTRVNVAFCVPRGAPAVQEGDQLVLRLRSGEARAYTVTAARDVPQQAAEVLAQRRAGITVVVCDGGETRRIWEGRFDGHADGRMFDSATTNISPTAGARDLELQVLAGYHVRQPDGTPLLAIGLRITNPTDRRVDVRESDVTVYDAMGSKLPVVHPLAAQLPAGGTLDHVLTLRATQGTQVYVRSAGPFGARAWHMTMKETIP